jgi:hypothetical protein
MGLIWRNPTLGRGLQALEFVERAVDAAFEASLLSREPVETAGSAGVGMKDGGEALLGGEAGAFP